MDPAARRCCPTGVKGIDMKNFHRILSKANKGNVLLPDTKFLARRTDVPSTVFFSLHINQTPNG